MNNIWLLMVIAILGGCASKPPAAIGKILVDLGYLQPPQLKQVLGLMGVYH